MSPKLSSRLIVDGETYCLGREPSLPDETLPSLTCWEKISEQEAHNLLINGPSFLWGCISAWELRGEKLYLTHLSGLYRMTTEESQFARWYSGELIIPEGNVMEPDYVRSKYERDLHLHFENGILMGTTMYYNRSIPRPDPKEWRKQRRDRIAGINRPRSRLGKWLFRMRNRWRP